MRRYTRKILSSALFLLLFWTPDWSYAQSASVAGVVTDSEDHFPLFGANVVHVGTGQGTAADENGQYTLRGLPEGAGLIRGSYTGYRLPGNGARSQKNNETIQ